MCQQHLGLVPFITVLSPYRYLRILCFFTALRNKCYTTVFVLVCKITHVKYLQGSYLLILCSCVTLKISALILDGTSFVITVCDGRLMLSLYMSDACWWSSCISFASRSNTWENTTLQQCLLISFAFSCWLENKLIYPFLIDETVMLLQILCPIYRAPGSMEPILW